MNTIVQLENPSVKIKTQRLISAVRVCFRFMDKGYKIESARVKRKYWLFGEKTYIIELKK